MGRNPPIEPIADRVIKLSFPVPCCHPVVEYEMSGEGSSIVVVRIGISPSGINTRREVMFSRSKRPPGPFEGCDSMGGREAEFPGDC